MKKDSRNNLSIFWNLLIASAILLLGAAVGKEVALVIVGLIGILLGAAAIGGIVVFAIATVQVKLEERKNQ